MVVHCAVDGARAAQARAVGYGHIGADQAAVDPQQAGLHGGVCRECVGASQIPAVGILVALHGQGFKVEEVVGVNAMPLEKRCVGAGATVQCYLEHNNWSEAPPCYCNYPD